LRIEFPGAIYHVESKGRPGMAVYKDEEDRKRFLNVLSNVVDRFGWLIHSYILMDSGYRFVLEIPEGNLSKGMRQLNGVYTQLFNKRHDVRGPVFQGRFKSVLFEKKSFLLPVCRDVVLGSRESKKNQGSTANSWSSYKAIAGQEKAPQFLYVKDVLSFFGKREETARRKYREYMRKKIVGGSPLSDRKSQVLLGRPKFLNEMKPILEGQRLAKKGPKLVRRRKSLKVLFKKIDGKTREMRNQLISEAHIDHGYTLMEIGDELGLHYTTVSKVINK